MNVALLADDELCTFEFGTLVELFGSARPEFDRWYYRRVAELEPGPLCATGVIFIEPQFSLKLPDRARSGPPPSQGGAGGGFARLNLLVRSRIGAQVEAEATLP